MFIAMVLAHLLGDFVLQWNRLAAWKGRAYAGVAVHGAIVTLTTIIVAIAFDPAWWMWALAIGIVHTGIDATNLAMMQGHSAVAQHYQHISALGRLILDQALHVAIIIGVLTLSGQMELHPFCAECLASVRNATPLISGYVFLTMPCWILVEFVSYFFVHGTAPDFSQQQDKYPAMVERLIMLTLLLTGQLPLALMIPMPRLILDSRASAEPSQRTLLTAKLLTSVLLALLVGQLLQTL